MQVRLSHSGDAAALARFYQDNAAFLQPWEPLRPAGFHQLSAWQERLQQREQEQQQGRGAYFVAYQDEQLIGVCNLNNVVQGVFQAAHLGYALAQSAQGQGKMFSICQQVLDYGFNQLGLNRIMANYMPHNLRSARLLQRLGFVIEGKASRYLQINGRWEDHILTAKLNPARLSE
ncbi:GNAT family N-acetyltransferase [Balneatrix alpica]|uniref:GNAT family N-acetyltransferase n=1 Tax=Balneatrix alpica TaxID=75684 RepID=UPI00273A19EF|nr:GNAT family N-acetyltransferase [Balneatrix alpica]